MAKQLLESKDYEKMITLQQDPEFFSNMTKAYQDLNDKHPKAGELFNKINHTNGYDGIKSTFESLDKQAKLILVQNYEMTFLIQYLYSLGENKGQGMDYVDQMFSPMDKLCAALKSNL